MAEIASRRGARSTGPSLEPRARNSVRACAHAAERDSPACGAHRARSPASASVIARSAARMRSPPEPGAPRSANGSTQTNTSSLRPTPTIGRPPECSRSTRNANGVLPEQWQRALASSRVAPSGITQYVSELALGAARGARGARTPRRLSQRAGSAARDGASSATQAGISFSQRARASALLIAASAGMPSTRVWHCVMQSLRSA